jgi:hypothetical protein
MSNNNIYIKLNGSPHINHFLIEIINYLLNINYEKYNYILKKVNDKSFLLVCEFIYNQIKHKEIKINKPITTYYCGHINKIHSNGYIEFCNIHKYMHDEIEHSFESYDDNEKKFLSQYEIITEYNDKYSEIFNKILNLLL